MTRRWAGTEKRLLILNYLCDHINWIGYPPSYREIATSCEIASTSTVHYHLSVLEQMGYISRVVTQARTIRITNKGRRYLTETST